MGSAQIWLGSAGVGKSTRICREIATGVQQDPFGPSMFWIVPADASYAAEQILMNGVSASLRSEVITLRRLAERINQQLGCLPAARVNTTGRRLLLADVYCRVRDRLQILVRQDPSFGFLDAILGVFREVEEYDVDLDEIMRRSSVVGWSATDGRIRCKLQDIHLLYSEYCKELTCRSLADAVFLLSSVQERLNECELLQGATVFLDGFSDLSPQELKFVVKLAQVSERMVIALSIDPAWTSIQDPTEVADNLYAPNTLRLYKALIEALSAAGVETSVEEIAPGSGSRHQQAPDLKFLSEKLFASADFGNRPAAQHLRIAAAQNPRVEAEGVAREIARLVQSGQATYGDFAVIVPHLDDYAPHLRASFEQHRIPNYLDAYPSFAHHPIAKLVLGAMDLVESCFGLESIQRLLKCDLLPIRRDDADWLETYLYKHEVSGVDVWLQSEAWRFSQDVQDRRMRAAETEDRRADELRRKFSSVLGPFFDRVALPVIAPSDFAEAVWHLLQTVSAKRLVAEWMVNEDGAESPLQASMHEQAWQKLVALLNDLTETLPEAPASRQLLFQLVRDDVTQQTLATIPAGIDEVLITDVERTRGWEAETVFLMGVSDGVLPHKVHAAGVLQDEERDWVNRLTQGRFGETTAELQRAQRTSIYQAFTRAKRVLYLTYPLSGIDGKEMRPSSLLSRAREVFLPGTVIEMLWLTNATDFSEDASQQVAWTYQTAMSYVIQAIRRAEAGDLSTLEGPVFRALVIWLMQDDHGQNQVKRAVSGMLHKTRAISIGSDRSVRLYGNPFRTNVYQLESFAKCPFQHFVRYGLKVKADEGPEVSPAVRGTLIHDSLLTFVETQMSDVAQWKTLSDENAVLAMRAAFELVLASSRAAQWRRFAMRQQQAEEAFRTLRTAAVVLTRHARHGLFEPKAMELAFGAAEEQGLAAFEIPLDHEVKLVLGGRIDRVDAATDGADHAFRIVDYKSSQMDIDLTKVANGLQLQLPVYAAVVEHHSEALFGRRCRPAGVIYLPLTTKAAVKDVPEAESVSKMSALKAMQSKGLMVHDQKLVSWMDDRLPAGASTELFKQVFTKDGRLTAYAPVVSAEQWSLLIAHALRQAKELAARILDGEVEIAPYKYGPETPCNYCAYAAVCQFDLRRDTRLYRRIERIDKTKVWSDWADNSAEVMR